MFCRTMLFLLLACLLSACADTPKPPRAPLRLRVLTYNIHHGQGTDGKFDYQRLADIINRVKPDLVALQEVDVKTKRSNGVDQAAVLAELTGMQSYFAEAMPYDGGSYGNAILHRSPDDLFYGERVALQSASGDEPRAVGVAEVVPWGDPGPLIVFASTHLCHKSNATRVSQVDQINTEIFNISYARCILAGDFNFTPDSLPYQNMIEAGWVDAAAAFGDPRPTVPAENPQQRIDYVFIRPANRWRVIDVQVLDEPVASDHAPLLVELEFIRPK